MAQALGKALARLLGQHRLDRVVVAGGDTSGHAAQPAGHPGAGGA